MRVVNSFSILVCERNSLLVRSLRPWGSSRELDVLHHFQICLPWLGRFPCRGPSYNNFYFSKWGSWRLFHLSLQLLVLVISSKKISQFSLPNKILYFLFQIKTLIHVMSMISVEAAILVPIAHVGIPFHFLWPLQGWVILDLHKHLLKWHVQWRILLTPCWRAIQYLS